MSRVALVTAKIVDEDIDLQPLLDAVRAEGIDVKSRCWDDDAVDWAGLDLAVLRSTWDYVDRYDEFLEWIDATAKVVTLLNPLDVLRWNMDKHYLRSLTDDHGIAVIPTQFFEPGTSASELEPMDGDIVVKPVRGASSVDALRHASIDDARRHLATLLDQGRAVMVQSYVSAIETYGETGMVYFAGELSHAFGKGPILTKAGASPVDGLYAPEAISPREPTFEQRDLADRVVHACAKDLLYARIDLVPSDDGQPVVSEVELTEPSFFVDHAPGAAARFAKAVAAKMST